MENISFGVTSGLAVLVGRHPDVIYSNTWPLFATSLLWAVARIRRIPMVVSIQDIYPESLIAQGRMQTDSRLARALARIDGYVTRHCRAVIVISESFADVYRKQRGVAPENVHVVPNWIDEQLVQVNEQPAVDFRAELRIPAEAVLMVYGGNIGVAAGVETVIEAFQQLSVEQNTYLLIAGEGARLAECRRLAATAASRRIRFYSPWPQHETSMVLNAADILLLPTRGTQSLASVPSKLITYMMTGKPVVALAVPQSELADLVTKTDCGWLVEPDHPELLANVLREVVACEKSALKQRGQAGRDYALAHLSRQACLPRVIAILEKAAA